MFSYRVVVGFYVAFLLCSFGFSATQTEVESRQTSEILWDVLDGGGGRSSSSVYILSGSLNQTSIGISEDGHNAYAGYWYGVNFAPLPFSLISPADDDTIEGAVILEWQDNGDPDAGDIVTYFLYYATQSDFSDADSACNLAEPVCTLSGLLGDTTYYWKVKAYDQWWSWKISSEIWSFYIEGAATFIRADANGDSTITMSDAIYTLRHLYVPGSDPPTCMKTADSDDNGDVAMADAIYTLKYLYVPEEPPPPAPFPDCGVDQTPDGLECQSHPCMGSRQAVRKMGSVR